MKHFLSFLLVFICISWSNAQVIINEVLADPPADLVGDSNGDGIRSTTDDEFVELLNISDTSVDLSKWTISDIVDIRHEFPEGTIIKSGEAIVIFGGGVPSLSNPGAQFFTASSGGLGINNAGEELTLADSLGNTIDFFAFTNSLGNDVSITYTIEGDVNSGLIDHDQISSLIFSPGTRSDGSNFTPVITSITPKNVTILNPKISVFDVKGTVLYEGLFNDMFQYEELQQKVLIIQTEAGSFRYYIK